jgi:type 1 fimbria pilin
MSLRLIFVGAVCLICLAAGSVRAQKEVRRLSFTGSIQGKTCNISPQEVPALMSSGSFRMRRMTCPQADKSTIAAPTYVLSSTHLTGVTTDPLLDYFDGYVTAEQGDAVLLTQIYD